MVAASVAEMDAQTGVAVAIDDPGHSAELDLPAWYGSIVMGRREG